MISEQTKLNILEKIKKGIREILISNKENNINNYIDYINSIYIEYDFKKIPTDVYVFHIFLLELKNEIEHQYKLLTFLRKELNFLDKIQNEIDFLQNNNFISFDSSKNKMNSLLELFNFVILYIETIKMLFLLGKDEELLVVLKEYNQVLHLIDDTGIKDLFLPNMNFLKESFNLVISHILAIIGFNQLNDKTELKADYIKLINKDFKTISLIVNRRFLYVLFNTYLTDIFNRDKTEFLLFTRENLELKNSDDTQYIKEIYNIVSGLLLEFENLDVKKVNDNTINEILSNDNTIKLEEELNDIKKEILKEKKKLKKIKKIKKSTKKEIKKNKKVIKKNNSKEIEKNQKSKTTKKDN